MFSFSHSRSLSLAILTLAMSPIAGCGASPSEYPDEPVDMIGEAVSAVTVATAFQLRNVQAGTCLNVEGGSSAPNTNTHQWICDATNPANLWKWVGTGEWRQLQNVQAGTCLNVEGGSSAPNTNTHQWICDGTNPANLWKWVGTGNARQLVNKQAGTCLNVEGGSSELNTNTHQFYCDQNNPANQWVMLVDGNPAPTSCTEVKAAQPNATNGEYTLQAAGELVRIYCDDMANTPKEYLTLEHVGGMANFSKYVASDFSPGDDVTTHYFKIRIDLAALTVDISDQTFATSTGELTHSIANDAAVVTSMPFGIAMACDAAYDGHVPNPPSSANIDLRDTPFAIAPNQFGQGGSRVTGEAVYSQENQVVELEALGWCGWIQPLPHIYNPFNNAGGYNLKLVLPGAQ